MKSAVLNGTFMRARYACGAALTTYGLQSMKDEQDADRLQVSPAADHAAGLPAVVRSARMLHDQMGVVRGARALLRINQKHGFDCPGCAWPEGSAHRKVAEFCENGVKAVAEEATERRIEAEFWAEHSVNDLRERSGYWLGQQGPLTHPPHQAPGSDPH